jgi:hypothetical protein
VQEAPLRSMRRIRRRQTAHSTELHPNRFCRAEWGNAPVPLVLAGGTGKTL